MLEHSKDFRRRGSSHKDACRDEQVASWHASSYGRLTVPPRLIITGTAPEQEAETTTFQGLTWRAEIEAATWGTVTPADKLEQTGHEDDELRLTKYISLSVYCIPAVTDVIVLLKFSLGILVFPLFRLIVHVREVICNLTVIVIRRWWTLGWLCRAHTEMFGLCGLVHQPLLVTAIYLSR